MRFFLLQFHLCMYNRLLMLFNLPILLYQYIYLQHMWYKLLHLQQNIFLLGIQQLLLLLLMMILQDIKYNQLKYPFRQDLFFLQHKEYQFLLQLVNNFQLFIIQQPLLQHKYNLMVNQFKH